MMPGIVVNEVAMEQQQQQQVKVRKPTKNEQRRAKKKAQKREEQTNAPTKQDPPPQIPDTSAQSAPAPAIGKPNKIEPTIEVLRVDSEDSFYGQFKDVFAKFQDESSKAEAIEAAEKQQVFFNDDENVQDEDEEEETKQKLSKKARKARDKLSIAELKAMAPKPEFVEWTDVSSTDPKLLVNIKATRNVVQVPSHWGLKREYLSSKRGVEKGNFRLPQFIAETGIAEMRTPESSSEQTLKQSARERVKPTIGKLDIDYQKLFEAFFRRQTKPHLTRFGEVYYEGKEYEADLRHFHPGEHSDALREALNMPANAPAPWHITQQKLGPPPSYPALKIAGINAPLPPGGKWGFEPGQYGKPPLKDESTGVPLWGGDLFGTEALKRAEAKKMRPPEAPVSRALWGELQSLQEEDAEDAIEEEEDDEEDEEEEDETNVEEGKEEDIGGTGLQTPFGGAATPSGLYSTTGMKSMAEEFDLRKKRAGNETEEPTNPRSAGQVLQEHSIRAEGFFGGERAYNLKGAQLPVLGSEVDERGKKRKAGDLDVSVDVDTLEREDGLSKGEVQKRYDETRQRERVGQWNGKVDQEDLSNMIAEENAKRLKRDHDKQRRR